MGFCAAEQFVLLPLADGFAGGSKGFVQMRIDVQHDVVGAGIDGGNQCAFYYLVRGAFQKEAVFEGARLVFVGVADDVTAAGNAGGLRHCRPFAVGGEACAAHAAQSGFFQYFGNLPRGGQCVLQTAAAACGKPCV